MMTKDNDKDKDPGGPEALVEMSVVDDDHPQNDNGVVPSHKAKDPPGAKESSLGNKSTPVKPVKATGVSTTENDAPPRPDAADMKDEKKMASLLDKEEEVKPVLSRKHPRKHKKSAAVAAAAKRLTDNRSPFWSSDEGSGRSKDSADAAAHHHHHSDDDDDDDYVEHFHDEPADKDVITNVPKTRRKLLRRLKSGEDNKDSTTNNSKRNALEKMALWTVANKDETTVSPPPNNKKQHKKKRNCGMTAAEIEICEQLDEEYERALEEREIGYAARYTSVRQAAFLSVSFMLIYLTLGTTFFLREQEDMELNDALLFLIYTITTVGYGHIHFPETARFQIFVIVYIFVGIATLTIMVAQCYQWIALEATRAQHSRDKADLERRGKEMVSARLAPVESEFEDDPSSLITIAHERSWRETIGDCLFGTMNKCKLFFLESEVGRGLSVLFPFAGLIGIGAGVVGPLEGWTVVESIYFAVVSLTTVGFGDYVPTETASIWFCIFWLPFSIGFMSLFLSNVASFYIRTSDKNIARLEHHMRRKLQKEKDAIEKERSEALKRALRGQEQQDDDLEVGNHENDQGLTASPTKSANGRLRKQQLSGFATLPDDDGIDEELSEDGNTALFGSPESEQSVGQIHREMIVSKSKYRPVEEGEEQPTTTSMSTMKNVIETVRENVAADSDRQLGGPESRFMSINTNVLLRNSAVGAPQLHKKPSFALRVLVQERFAEIIAIDVAGFQSNVEIQEDTLSVTIDTLRNTADKWLIPRRARKAFRAVAFEALYFVGEHGLITRGAEALYDLTPFEFHGLFSPLVAAMGDADTMSGWLASTEVLAEVDLRREPSRSDSLASSETITLSYAQRVRMSREREKLSKRRISTKSTSRRRPTRPSSAAKKKRLPSDDHVLT